MRQACEEKRQKRGRRRDILRKFNITPEEYELLLLKQGSVCAICKQPETALGSFDKKPKRLAVDHCHKTDVVRGLLCSRCNLAIGYLGEQDGLFDAAKQYLNLAKEKLNANRDK